MSDALEIEMRPIGDLKPNPRNARTHSARQIEMIAASLEEFGWTNPVLLDGADMIVAGHGRVEAAKSIGLESVPTIKRAHWTPEQVRAYTLADNRLAELAGWNDEILKLELLELKALDFDLGTIGFSEKDLSPSPAPSVGSLAELFGVVPFTVLNAREGWWQERKRGWLALGIQSEVGRGENLLAFSDTVLSAGAKKKRGGG